MTPSSALTTSTKSSGRNYGMLAEGLNNRESFDVWKVQEARVELAMKTLEKWFSPYARALAPGVWRSCEPALIFDFYFNMFTKDIPMVATILHEQLRMFTFTRGQKIAEFLTVFRILIDMIESLEQAPMSEFQKRVTLERAFLRTNYNHYRHVFHNAKMIGYSFNETIGYIERFELEDTQMKEAQALMQRHDESREPKKSGKTSNQPKVQASVNLAAEQPHRGNHAHRSGAPGGRGPGRGRAGGRSGNSGKGRGNSADRRYQGAQQQEPQSPVPPRLLRTLRDNLLDLLDNNSSQTAVTIKAKVKDKDNLMLRAETFIRPCSAKSKPTLHRPPILLKPIPPTSRRITTL
jgi:hypothetical protein